MQRDRGVSTGVLMDRRDRVISDGVLESQRRVVSESLPTALHRDIDQDLAQGVDQEGKVRKMSAQAIRTDAKRRFGGAAATEDLPVRFGGMTWLPRREADRFYFESMETSVWGGAYYVEHDESGEWWAFQAGGVGDAVWDYAIVETEFSAVDPRGEITDAFDSPSKAMRVVGRFDREQRHLEQLQERAFEARASRGRI